MVSVCNCVELLQYVKKKGALLAVVVGVIAVLFVIGRSEGDFKSTPIVKVGDGHLQGRILKSRSGQEFMAFLGIPYAEPPVGDLRFEPPIPLKKRWRGVKRVTQYPPHCLQFDGALAGTVLGKEDCLQLNVFTYITNPRKKRPVMVHIHGGAFIQGASSLVQPNYIMDHDVVLVTMNYRVGPLGFMNTGDDLIRGNNGLKDQNLVLKWVKNNIAKFGGDASQVTIFGESAGAVSVHYHMLSPLSRGLFHRAISQSGVTTCPWAIDKNPRIATMNYIKLLGCPQEDSKLLMECLKNMDGKELVRHQISTMTPTNDFLIFQPTRETVVRDDTFLSEFPEDILKSGNFAKVPFMFGSTSGEGGLRTARYDAMPELIAKIDKEWEKLAHILVGYDELIDKPMAARKIRKAYFGESKFTDSELEFKRNFTSLITDAMFFEPIHRAALLHAKQDVPTYLYHYVYDSKSVPSIYTVVRAVRPDDWIPAGLKIVWASIVDYVKKNYLGSEGVEFGVTHGNDLFQLWNADGISSYVMDKHDFEFSRDYVKLVVDFARNEEPLKFKGLLWPSIQAKDVAKLSPSSKSSPRLKYMQIDKEAKIIDEPFTDRLPFWETLRRDYIK